MYTLIGHLKPPINEHIFLIPIYKRGIRFFTHQIDFEKVEISGFTPVNIEDHELVVLPLNFQCEYSIGSEAIFGYQIDPKNMLLGNYAEIYEKLFLVYEDNNLNRFKREELVFFFNTVKPIADKRSSSAFSPYQLTISEQEAALIKEALSHTKGNTSLAAQLLGISRKTLLDEINEKSGRKSRRKKMSYNRCKKCGRTYGLMRRFGICRICLREMAFTDKFPTPIEKNEKTLKGLREERK